MANGSSLLNFNAIAYFCMTVASRTAFQSCAKIFIMKITKPGYLITTQSPNINPEQTTLTGIKLE